MASVSYPVRLEGTLDTRLSRWLWLVKWLLAIPHYLVLLVLWVAVVLLSLVALVAILFTGRYPRGIFGFNVGVLRWTWRVAFYSYGALGTDRYPPFTLDPVDDYPATLEVDYPERLSRGLALVKWWLLAIPHYLIVGVFAGGAGAYAWESDWRWWGGGGLVGLLTIVAGFAVLFTARYPAGLFDFVIGLDRWVARVVAYAALMTDEYPPFRLDQGGREATGADAAVPPAAPAAPAGRTSVGRIIVAGVGTLASLTAAAVLAAGGFLLFLDQTQRDSAGFLQTSTERFETPTYALTSESIDIHIGGPDWLDPADLFGEIRIRAASAEPGQEIFVGIGRADDVDAYLDGVGHDEVRDVDVAPFSAGYTTRPGGPPAAPPTDEDLWVASVAGPGTQSLVWDVEEGEWSVVVMNADALEGVQADVSIGAELPILLWLWIGVLVLGGALLAVGVFLVVLGLRRRPAT